MSCRSRNPYSEKASSSRGSLLVFSSPNLKWRSIMSGSSRRNTVLPWSMAGAVRRSRTSSVPAVITDSPSICRVELNSAKKKTFAGDATLLLRATSHRPDIRCFAACAAPPPGPTRWLSPTRLDYTPDPHADAPHTPPNTAHTAPSPLPSAPLPPANEAFTHAG